MNKNRKVIVYVDMDDTMFHYTKRYNELSSQYKFPQSQRGFFENLQPIDGAIDAFHWLMKHSKFDPYILTAPSEMNPLCYTEKRNSIHRYFGSAGVSRLIISPVKHLSQGHILIDDKSSGKGQDEFDGELILFGSDEYPGWNVVIERMKRLTLFNTSRI